MQQLMRRGAAGTSFRPAATLAERKAALIEKRISINACSPRSHPRL